MGIDPAVVHLNEGHAAFASLELARAELAAGASLDDALAAARARTVFTTHTPVPAGNDTYEPELVVRLAGHAGRRGRRRPRHDRPPGPHPPRRRRRALRRDPVRAAHEPLGQRRQPPPRRGRARDVGRAVARSRRRRRADRLRHQRRAPPHLGRRSDARRCSTAISARAGWTAPRTPPRGTALDSVDDAELWAARREQRAALVTWARERSMVDRLGRDEPREYVEAPDFDPDVLTIGFARRLATYKRLHVLLQSAEGIVDLLSGERKIQILHGGQGAPARRRRQAQPAGAVRGQGHPRDRLPRRLPRRLRPHHRRAPGHRLRRVGQPPAPAARGERHERDEVGGQRRPAAQRPRRLVGRGATTAPTAGRCRATSTTTTAPRTPATPPSSCACSTTRSSRPSTTATSAACRPRGWR